MKARTGWNALVSGRHKSVLSQSAVVGGPEVRVNAELIYDGTQTGLMRIYTQGLDGSCGGIVLSPTGELLGHVRGATLKSVKEQIEEVTA